jgi:hypothetical protein
LLQALPAQAGQPLGRPRPERRQGRAAGGLAFDFVAQFPPEPLRIFGPQQHPETSLFEFRAAAPFVIQAPKPSQVLEELVAERGLQPGEILLFRRPIAVAVVERAALVAKGAPGRLGLAALDTTAHEIAPLAGQRQVPAMVGGCGLAERTVFLAKHRLSVRA